MEDFLLQCQPLIANDCCLWVALQCNAINDSSNSRGNFEKDCKEMFKQLESQHQFMNPSLTTNMRNTKNICNASQNVSAVNSANYTMKNNVINKLDAPTTTTTGNEVEWVPISNDNFEQNLRNYLKTKMNWLQSKKLIILHDDQFESANLKDIFSNLLNINKNKIISHDTHPNDCTRLELETFLSSPQDKLGIFRSKFVTGMEGSNILYFCATSSSYDESLRCSMTRAVSNLIIVQKVKNDVRIGVKLNSMYIIKDFSRCRNNFRRLDEVNNCKECNLKKICNDCALTCHQNHDTKHDTYIEEENKYTCQCKNCLIK